MTTAEHSHSPAHTFGEYQTQLQLKETAIQQQLDRIYKMVEEKKPASFLKIEYKTAVERITEKYHILTTMLDHKKEQLSAEEYTAQLEALRAQYKEDIVMLAVAIDEAVGDNSAVSAQNNSAN